MNRPDTLERDLTAWLAETAAPREPDFSEDILWITARTRQRPRWSFGPRWLQAGLLMRGRRAVKPIPWRTIGLLAALALLIVAAVAFYVGSQPRLPPPFGLAATGLVAYADHGDIYTVDPSTGAREALVTGPDADREPRWSLDGTRLAFLRLVGTGERLVIFDLKTREVVATTVPIYGVDTDTITWSPDNRTISANGSAGLANGLFTVDARSGAVTPLAVDYQGLDVHWRPPDGRQILYLGGTESAAVLFVADVDDGSVTEVARAGPGEWIRPSGWTPDGRRVVFMRFDDSDRVSTHILDMTTGEEVVFDGVSFGHVSNDGSRMVALDKDGMVCVASVSGGPCVPIVQPSDVYEGTHAAGAQWSPDDRWILMRGASLGSAIFVDPDSPDRRQPSWIAYGGESIQRVAP